jgi:quercetin dioxygenase-like cupin family protein
VELKRGSELKASRGNAAYFTNEVWIEPLVATSLMAIKGVRVTFVPGARTAWHTHPGGQILHVVSGRGWVQKEGEAAWAMSAGDTVIIGAGEKHWHGAAADCPMVHVAMQPIIDGVDTVWLEQVSEAQYPASGAESTKG